MANSVGNARNQQSLRDTLICFPQRAAVKAFLVFFIVLSVVQSSTPLLAGESGEPKSPASDADFFYYIHDDHLGSSHILTEGKQKGRHAGIVYDKGDILQRLEYSPFGQERYVLNPNLKFDPSYTGQLYDLDTGLYYYKSRYYNPQLGRFIQPDTVVPDAKNLQAFNRYAYVANNPLKYVDPTGHFWGWFKKIFGAFIGALISIITGFALAPLGIGVWAAVIGGAVGGAIGGAISGGLKGALLGGVLGAVGGAVFYGANVGLNALGLTNEWGRFAVMAGVGASISGATGGWKGLVIFGAGLAGALTGKLLGAATGLDPNSKGKDIEYRPSRPHLEGIRNNAFSHAPSNAGNELSFDWSGSPGIGDTQVSISGESYTIPGAQPGEPIGNALQVDVGTRATLMGAGATLVEVGREFAIAGRDFYYSAPHPITRAAGIFVIGLGSAIVGFGSLMIVESAGFTNFSNINNGVEP